MIQTQPSRQFQKRLLIRADASPEIGAGHIMRCLALAQAWQDAGGCCTFVLASHAPALEERLKAEGLEVLHLANRPGSRDDAAQTAALARQVGAAWVVVDGYPFGDDYQHALKAAGLRVLFVDDYGHAGYYAADLVLNQNLSADEKLYRRREPYTQLLLGTRYALLRREFWPWHGWQREIAKVGNKVLVTLGGADSQNATLKVIQALQQVVLDGLEAVVVVGGMNPHLTELRSAIQQSKRNIRLESNVPHMPDWIAWADIAIAAGGSTCWELAFMGLPALILVLADNQQSVATALEAAGAAVNLGRHTALAPADIAQAVSRLAAAQDTRAAIAQRAQELVDGSGAFRIVSQMSGNRLLLRPVQAHDCRLVWEWANDPLTRAFSFSLQPIPWERHLEWFTAKLSDPLTLFCIAINADGVPIGQIRYQIEGTEAVVSVSVAPNQRGKGYGREIICLGAQRVFASTPVELIHAYVKPDNVASLRAFAAAGFVNGGLIEIKGNQAVHWTLRKDAQP